MRTSNIITFPHFHIVRLSLAKNNTMTRLLFTTCSILFFGSLFAQNEDSLLIRKIADEILMNGTAYSNLHTLTKKVGGRITGSPQMYKAEEWAQKALKEAGAEKVYLQECNVPRWIRGAKEEAKLIIGNKEESLAVLTLGNSVGTGSKGITAPVILINSFDELEQKKEEIKGKIVFYNYKFNPKFIQTFFGYADAVRYRGGGASRAAKYGAVAVLVRSITNSTDNYPHTGAMGYDNANPKIPALAVGLWDADKIADALQKNNNVKIFIKSNAYTLADILIPGILRKGLMMTEPVVFMPLKCCAPLRRSVIIPNTLSVWCYLQMKKIVATAEQNMQNRQKQKMKNIFSD